MSNTARQRSDSAVESRGRRVGDDAREGASPAPTARDVTGFAMSASAAAAASSLARASSSRVVPGRSGEQPPRAPGRDKTSRTPPGIGAPTSMLYFRAMYSDAMPFGRRPLFGFGTGDGVGVGGVPRRVFPRSALASVVIPSSSSVSMAISMTFGAAFAFSLARGRVFAASLALPPPVGRADAISSSVELLGGVSGSAPAVHPSLDPDAFASTAHSIPTRRSYRSYRRVSVDFDELFTGVGAWGGAAVAVAVAVAARAPGWSHAVTRFRSVHSFSMCSGTFASRVQRDASSAAAAAAAAAAEAAAAEAAAAKAEADAAAAEAAPAEEAAAEPEA
mmetsp:Transcript_2775/g.8928  ORF Transcript_2775/g.8928 Transcript_2775/m.8928 type:complete len:334 (+) Transcript_2775:810-1811(+)